MSLILGLRSRSTTLATVSDCQCYPEDRSSFPTHAARPFPAPTSAFEGGVETHIAFENTRGLPELYNAALQRGTYDCVVFCHDDVELCDMFLMRKLETAFHKFDVVGVVGARHFNPKQDFLAWHTCDDRYKVGGLLHATVSGNDSKFFYAAFGPTPAECLVVDGLFLAVNAATVGNLRFDERLTFDFYDIDFCLSARQLGLKVGVAPVLVTHLSHGPSYGTERYRMLQGIFVSKYQDMVATTVGEILPDAPALSPALLRVASPVRRLLALLNRRQ